MSSLPAFHSYELQCRLRVKGPDAGDYLQGQFSNDLSPVSPGQCAYGLWLNRKGKIVADSFVLRLGAEDFALFSYHCSESVVHERLDAFLVMEDAELVRSTGAAAARCVFGEEAQRGVSSALEMALPEKGAFSTEDGVVAFWGRRCSSPVLEIVFLEDASLSRIEKADAYLKNAELSELGLDEMAARAIEAKVPQIGLGFGESDLPQELGLEVDAVSFRKGCYLGQEVMARLHAMGKVRKGLRRVSIGEPNTISAADLPLDLLDADGKRQGQLRSIAYPKSGGVGLAVVSSGFSGGVLRAGAVELMLDGEEDAAHG